MHLYISNPYPFLHGRETKRVIYELTVLVGVRRRRKVNEKKIITGGGIT